MTEKYLPPQKVRPIVICIFRHPENKEKILCGEFFDFKKEEWFYRPLGGEIEFGEHSSEAIVREIREELQTEIEDVQCFGVLENFFSYMGKPGHEIVFVYDAKFKDRSLYKRKHLKFVEGETHHKYAHWHELNFFSEGKAKLYPNGLLEALKNLRDK